MTETELREELAPKIAAKLLSRTRGINHEEAAQLAHEIIATVQAATLAADHSGGAPSAGAAG